MGRGPGDILVLNAGSSSIKFAVFDGDLAETHRGIAAGSAARRSLNSTARARPNPVQRPQGRACGGAERRLDGAGVRIGDLRAAAHRVVHGGATLSQPVRLTPENIAEIAVLHAAGAAAQSA